MTTRTRLAAGAAALSALLAGVAGFAADAGKAILPAKQAEALIKADAELLKAVAADSKLKPKPAARKAQALAVMIAAYAQDAKLAGLRDEALKVAGQIKEKGIDAAKSANLSLGTAAATGTAPKKLAEPDEIDVVMKQFSSERGGGLGFEAELQKLQKKAKLAKADFERLTYVGYKTAIIGAVTEPLAPPASGNKKPADWVKWSKDMTEAATEVGSGSEKGDEKLVKAGLRKLETSCVNCHNVFRNE
jgi:hypothetical protein